MTLKADSFDVMHFLPANWTSRLKNVPILGSKYEIIDLNKDFIEFLESEGMALDDDRPFTSGFSSSDEDYPENDSDISVKYFKPSEKFPEIHEKIRNAVNSMGGSVIPKLNWTVPKVVFCTSFQILIVSGFGLDISQYP